MPASNASGMASAISAFATMLSNFANQPQAFFDTMFNAWNAFCPYMANAKTSLMAYQCGPTISAFCDIATRMMNEDIFYERYDYLYNRTINALKAICNN